MDTPDYIFAVIALLANLWAVKFIFNDEHWEKTWDDDDPKWKRLWKKWFDMKSILILVLNLGAVLLIIYY